MMRKRLLVVMLAAIGASPARADDLLPIRPGMSLDEITQRLQPRCHMFRAGDVSGGSGGKTVTCYLTDGKPPPMVTASISKKDRAWYVGWWTPIPGPDPIGAADKLAPMLGFSAERAFCDRESRKMPCWTGADGTVLYAAGRDDRSGMFAFYLHNEPIEKADAR